MTAHINIGTNAGHRAANIDRAVHLLECELGQVTARSRTIESDPWGFNSDTPFLNAGVNVETELGAKEIVSILKRIQETIAPGETHRNERGEYVDRVIDLDLICLGDKVETAEEATVPHPRAHMRGFVLTPLSEILPQWRHPLLGKNAEEMLAELNNK